MNVNEVAKNAEETVEDVFKITIPEKRAIKPVIPTEVTTLKDLCNDVNALFAVYKDYRGCRIVPVITQEGRIGIETVIFFQQGSSAEGYADAFSANSVPNMRDKVSIVDRIRANDNLSKGKKYSITEEGKAGIGDFIDKIAKKNADWTKTCVAETVDGAYGAQRTVLISVKHISLQKIVEEIYGTKDENGKKIYYNIVPLRQISTEPNPNWIVQISSISEATIAETMANFGMMPMTSSQIMVERK